MIYFVICGLLLIFALLEQIDDENKISGKIVKSYGFYLILVFLVLFTGLRNDTGVDHEAYLKIYNDYPSNFTLFFSRFEPGFNIFIHIVKNVLNLSFNYFTLFFSAVSILVKTIFFKKYFKYPILLLFLYFPLLLNTEFGLIRQGMAAGIFLWTIPAIKNRNLFRFLVICLTACSFHYSALICFPLYFLYPITITIKRFLILFLFGFLLNISGITTLLFLYASKLFSGFFIGNILNYIVTAYGTNENSLIYFIRPSTITAFFILIVMWISNKDKFMKRQEKELEFSFFNIYFILFLVILMFNNISVLAFRAAFFSEVMDIVMFYYCFSVLKEKEFKSAFVMLLFLYGLIRTYMILVHSTFGGFGHYQLYSEFFGI